ncbi:hypothetical protein E4T56_gene12591 [Termitomyces sp. T112]|nr:hypothetical protein E4T56_gene12591 [Termitomyces sp. T112]KAH0582839.1 hypothetical protein H2248_010745 [Termitomyces sp. 'cryptogamus']KNZ74623.1 hypothetical protein J132_06577 [Termitomyces sp. J132]
MGFLKRMFSLGSKKNKKQHPHVVRNADPKLRALEEEEHEAVIGRLLRSSSTRYTVVSEVEYSSLPPLPHPINDVLQAPDANAIRTRGESTTSIASSTISRRGTYNVTVHKRKQHTPAESQKAHSSFSGDATANEHVSENKEVSSHLLELRSHPSVASLLSMYDEHGRIPDEAFSNNLPSPEKRERPQTRRNGSTLRELLGESAGITSRNSNEAGSTEGDISWAERFLGEGDSASSATSSVDLPTPSTPNTHPNNDLSFATDNDFSMTTYENPDISSMEVELSVADSIISAEIMSMGNPYKQCDPTTPRRASQVFQFLTERRRSAYNDQLDSSLPELPNASSVLSHDASSSRSHRGHFSDDPMNVMDPTHSTMAMRPPNQPNDDIQMNLPSVSQSNNASTINTPANAIETVWVAPNGRSVENLVNAPTRVIITAPTPSGKAATPSRIPRGARSPYRRLSSNSSKMKRISTLTVRETNAEVAAAHRNDSFTPALRKHRQKRVPSDSSSSSARSRNIEIGPPTRLSKRGSSVRPIHPELDKENGPQLSVNSILPSTPIRSKSESKSLFRTAVTPSVFRPPPGNTPSPASSSELSPVGKQLMMDIRNQRSRARDVERQKSGTRFGYRSSRV